MLFSRATIALLALVVLPAEAAEWCFGVSELNAKTKTCSDKGWRVVQENRNDERLDCYMATGDWKRGLVVTPDSILFFDGGGDFPAANLQVDDKPPVQWDLVARRAGLELAAKDKRRRMLGEFQSGYKATVSTGNTSFTYSLIGFTKAYEQFLAVCTRQ
ncbi:MAG: hypothetical protein KDH88_15665 [Chromatiales bacterium]|nr:hypothetical protein [Chromatiales bacterium]